jgi:pimeloyl-ACP methyl ester carboxylesterase
MKRALAALLFSPLIVCAAVAAPPAAGSASPPAEAVRQTLVGRITDGRGQPLPDVRVGLRTANAVTQTNAQGRFVLEFTPPLAPVKDKKDPLDYLELDKDGYLGRTINLADAEAFAKPVDEKLEPEILTDERAEFSRRMSLGFTLPVNTPALQKFDSISPDLSGAEWTRFFSAMEARKQDGPTEQVFFQAYVPKEVVKLKAVFLFTRHGIGSLDHPRLREFARRNGIGLVSAKGNPVQRGFYPVSAIDEDIARLGRMLKHPELATVPVLTFGHSNGTGFAGMFPSQRPERVIAWISYHSGVSFHLQFPGVEKVPGLAMHGNIDPFAKNGQEQTIKNLRVNRNAPIALMMEGNVAHGPVDKEQNATWDFIAAFCEAAMRIRLNADGTLKPVVVEQGWLGANYDRAQGGQQELAIAPFADFKGDRSVANWLPDKQFAETWQRYGTTDPRPAK